MNQPIIALDFSSKQDIENFLTHFDKDEALFLKVGMELFYQEGADIVRWLKSLGHSVFLDLKLHDIPNTVKSAMIGIASLGVDMTNVHASGGKEMMEAALVGLREGTPDGEKPPVLIAVTQLTSTSEAQMHSDQLIKVSLKDSVSHYAKLTKESGLAGVVCSALEVPVIKQQTSSDFLCVTPGIRPINSQVSDQKRVVTPTEAHSIGSDYIVVGRPITRAANPYKIYTEIKKEWNGERV